jgi:hypothetical protein
MADPGASSSSAQGSHGAGDLEKGSQAANDTNRRQVFSFCLIHFSLFYFHMAVHVERECVSERESSLNSRRTSVINIILSY